MSDEEKNYLSGTSGLFLPVPNKTYYPEAFKAKSRLCYYSSLMNSIEINSSFYKIPLASTVKKWCEYVPNDFRFSFKLFKGITHAPQLAFNPAYLAKFIDVINQVGEKKACILVQFPPSVRIANLPQLYNLMLSLQEHNHKNDWNIALEFRHPSLYVEEVYELLEEHKLGMVIHDKGSVESPFDVVQNNFIYLRFHGPGGNYRGSYTDDVLSEYASYISEWLLDN
ncbi:MAG: DUF72 domain-containing protein, partial [Pedobacter sp.]